MQIEQDILDYTLELLQIHQPSGISGSYDGYNGIVGMTFVGDENPYVGEFTYSGISYNEFRERVIETAGLLVAQHNAYMSIPNRDAFIDSVTEDE